jgi:hypothetical protein
LVKELADGSRHWFFFGKTALRTGEILEVNQVASYFAYVNRTVVGLGVTTEGDILGFFTWRFSQSEQLATQLDSSNLRTLLALLCLTGISAGPVCKN